MRRINLPVKPVILSRGPSQEVIRTGNQGGRSRLLPALTRCKKDAGPYITAGIAIATDPETHIRNVSINRIQVTGPQETFDPYSSTPGTNPGKGRGHGKNPRGSGCHGNHPVELITACSKPPFGLDEFDLSGGLRETPLELVSSKNISLHVPARAEIILEGEIPPHARKRGVPLGDFMGYYALQHRVTSFS